MSTKSAKVDSLIREHLTLNEGLNAQPAQSPEASATQKLGEAARVTEIRQELVQILQAAPANKI